MPGSSERSCDALSSAVTTDDERIQPEARENGKHCDERDEPRGRLQDFFRR